MTSPWAYLLPFGVRPAIVSSPPSKSLLSQPSCSRKYWITGNLSGEAAGLCLTDGGNGLAACGNERDDQVFALPSGVKVIRDGVV